jgi:hypothetical protein
VTIKYVTNCDGLLAVLVMPMHVILPSTPRPLPSMHVCRLLLPLYHLSRSTDPKSRPSDLFRGRMHAEILARARFSCQISQLPLMVNAAFCGRRDISVSYSVRLRPTLTADDVARCKFDNGVLVAGDDDNAAK